MDIIGISSGDMDLDVGHVSLILIILPILVSMMDSCMDMMEHLESNKYQMLKWINPLLN
jgi:hypothetical protein